jgi:4-hydroxybenzoate polyprenyltransferase
LAIFSFSWATFIGASIVSRGIPQLFPLSTILTISFAMTTAAYIFNDVMDLEIDRINIDAILSSLSPFKSHLDCPIAQGQVSKKEALSLAILMTALALTLSLSVNTQTFLLCTAFLVLAFLYSSPKIYLKKRFIAKQTVAGTGGAISSLIGGAAVGQMSLSLLYAAVLFFIFTFVGSPIFDFVDIKGDRERGAKTLSVVLGPVFTIRFAVVTLLSFSAATILVYPLVGLNIVAPFLITSSILLFSWASFPLLRKWHDPRYLTSAYRKISVSFFVAELAVFLGVF